MSYSLVPSRTKLTDPVDCELPAAAALSDVAVNPTTPTVGAAALLWNGTNWSRYYPCKEGTALASAARTQTTSSNDQENIGSTGLVAYVRLTASGGAIDLTPQLEYFDGFGGQHFPVLVGPQITALGTYAYALAPGISLAAPVAGGIQAVAALPLPRRWRFTMTHGNANSQTYGVWYSLTR